MSLTVVVYDKRGMALPLTLMLAAILAFLGTTAFLTTTTDMKIGGNHRIGEQAFYSAQAGIEEARARLRGNATNPLVDSQPGETQWRAYIGDLEEAQKKGFDPDDDMHDRYDSLRSDLGYTIQVSHQTDEAGNMIYWGDVDGDGVNERNTVTGENIYVVASYGSEDGADKTIAAEMVRLPAIPVQSALYVEATTTVQGHGAHVIGTDACGGTDRFGIATTQDEGSVTFSDSPHIVGAGGSEPNIVYNSTDMDVGSIVNSFKESADFAYTLDSPVHTASSCPGPGDGWGTPAPGATPQTPSSCDASHIVYYDTGGTYVRLSGGVSGCGILLVEGDLDIEGAFSWYGVVLVTGTVFFTGNGDRNITGALMAGGSTVMGVLGGNTTIAYCSSAITDQTKNRPLRHLSWKENM